MKQPRTRQQWQEVATTAHYCLLLEAARPYGLIRGGPEVKVDLCERRLKQARAMGIQPDASEEALTAFLLEIDAVWVKQAPKAEQRSDLVQIGEVRVQAAESAGGGRTLLEFSKEGEPIPDVIIDNGSTNTEVYRDNEGDVLITLEEQDQRARAMEVQAKRAHEDGQPLAVLAMSDALAEQVLLKLECERQALGPEKALELLERARQRRIAQGIEKACVECGCSDTRACPDGCSWVAPYLCSGCARKIRLGTGMGRVLGAEVLAKEN